MEYKTCNTCKEDLPFDAFYKCKSGKFGLQAKCKRCLKEYELKNKDRIKAYRKKWRDEHKEETKEYNAEYRKNNQEELNEKMREYYQKTITEKKAYWKNYYSNKQDEMIERSREWYLANKDKKLAYDKVWAKEWRKKNKDKVNIYSHKRRALLKNLPSTLTEEQWKQIKSHFDNSCAYCGDKKPLEQEHFIPITQNGEYSYKNIIPACRSCNASKNNKNFFEWYPIQNFYSKEREHKILVFLDTEEQRSTSI